MSGNVERSGRREDARTRRTRDALGDALVDLLREKPYESITVQEVLDRAGVSRATFYTHYRDKEDLLESDMDEFLEMMANALSRAGDTSDRVAPVRELFEHVATQGPLRSALVASGKFQTFMDLATGHFARGIERRLAELPRSRGVGADRRAAMAHGHAGALLSLMTFWLDRGARTSAKEMDDLFHRMVWSGVAGE